MTTKQIETRVNFINEELKTISIEKLFQITRIQWGRDNNQTVWWYWRCQFDNFDNHLNDNLLK